MGFEPLKELAHQAQKCLQDVDNIRNKGNGHKLTDKEWLKIKDKLMTAKTLIDSVAPYAYAKLKSVEVTGTVEHNVNLENSILEARNRARLK